MYIPSALQVGYMSGLKRTYIWTGLPYQQTVLFCSLSEEYNFTCALCRPHYRPALQSVSNNVLNGRANTKCSFQNTAHKFPLSLISLYVECSDSSLFKQLPKAFHFQSEWEWSECSGQCVCVGVWWLTRITQHPHISLLPCFSVDTLSVCIRLQLLRIERFIFHLFMTRTVHCPSSTQQHVPQAKQLLKHFTSFIST